MISHKIIANNIKAEMTRKELTYEETSIKMGISKQNFSNKINNFSKGGDVKFSFIEKISEVLEVPITIFFAN